MKPVRTAARAMLAAIFVSSGAEAVISPERLVPHAKQVTDHLAPLMERMDSRLPTDTRTLIQVNGAVQVVGGLLMLTPVRRAAAVVLAGSLVPTTLAGHPFWQYDDRTERTAHRVNFLKNVGLLGGLLLAAMDTAGKPGLRWRAGHMADSTGKSVRRMAHNTRAKADIARKAAAMGRHIPG